MSVTNGAKVALPQLEWKKRMKLSVNKDLICFKLWATQCTLSRHFYSYPADGNTVGKLLALTVSSISAKNAKQHNTLNAFSAATLFIVVVGAGYSIYPAQARRYDLYFPFATGTAVTRLVHEKFLLSRLRPSSGYISSFHRRYKIYSTNLD